MGDIIMAEATDSALGLDSPIAIQNPLVVEEGWTRGWETGKGVFHSPSSATWKSVASSAVAPRKLKVKEETREKTNGLGCPTVLPRRLLKENALGPLAQMGKGEAFLTSKSLALFLGCSTRDEEAVHLQIMTPGAGLRLMTPDLEGMRYGGPVGLLSHHFRDGISRKGCK